MDLFANPNELKLLQLLLQQPTDDSDHDDHHHADDVGHGAGNTPNTHSTAAVTPAQQSHEPQSLAEWEHIQQQLNDDVLDQRQRPQYKIVYKQAVCTEDVYLQLGNRTTATASCETMIIRIDMPNESVDREHMQLDVSARAIDLHTPMYRLRLPLVQQIDPDRGSAQWDADKKVLTLTLQLVREFDFVNF